MGNTSEFYGIKDVPRNTFVTVAYDEADPKDVIAESTILKEYQTTLSRVKVDYQQTLPKLIREIHGKSHGIHLAGASYLGLMWHEDGLMMAQLASKACLSNLRQAASSMHVEKGSTLNKEAVLDDSADTDSTGSPSTGTEATGELSGTGAEMSSGVSADKAETLSHSSQMSQEALSNSNHAEVFADIV